MVIAIILALASATPAPGEPAPPKTIIEVHSEATFCSTLHQTVAPVLAGLIEDDRVIDVGKKALTKLLSDRAHGYQAAGMDRLQLENASLALVHNLAVIDGLLADTGKFPKNPRTDSDRTANSIKADLLSVVTRQKEKLNEIYGTMDTDELGSMLNDFPSGNPGFGPISNRPDPDMQKTPSQTTRPAVAGISAAAGDGVPVGHSVDNAVTIADLESRVSAKIMSASAACAKDR